MEKFPVGNFSRRSNKEGDSTAMIAVALQDHWTRTLSLGVPRNPRNVGLGPAARAKQKKEVKAVVDTGRGQRRIFKPKEDKEKEYVLDSEPPPLTLAQKFGLVDAPAQLMSETEWQNAKFQSNRRDDSHQPCVICKEDFGLQEQVLLSCTHVFHRACLQAFERFTGRKTCPMCRREQYQTRVIHEGAKAYKHICATRIQSVWRGYVVRCWYKKLRETRPPQDRKLRKKFFEDKLKTITDRMVRSCDFNVNDFLREMDQSLAASRDVFRNFDAMFMEISDEEWEKIQLTAVVRGHQECPICLTLLTTDVPDQTLDAWASGDDNHHSNSLPKKSREKHSTGAPTTARTRNQKSNCTTNKVPTVTNKLKPGAKEGEAVVKEGEAVAKEGEPVAKEGESFAKEAQPISKEVCGKPRQTVLLSCSHVFHETCLIMLEELAIGEIKHTCPICRTAYQKKIITL